MSDAVLHFVYNVDAKPTELIKDFVHRQVQPETYPCKICDVTYGKFLKRKDWDRYVKSLPLTSKFHTKSPFRKKFPMHTDTPLAAVFLQHPNKTSVPSVLISATELKSVSNLPELIKKLEGKLNKAGIHVDKTFS